MKSPANNITLLNMHTSVDGVFSIDLQNMDTGRRHSFLVCGQHENIIKEISKSSYRCTVKDMASDTPEHSSIEKFFDFSKMGSEVKINIAELKSDRKPSVWADTQAILKKIAAPGRASEGRSRFSAHSKPFVSTYNITALTNEELKANVMTSMDSLISKYLKTSNNKKLSQENLQFIPRTESTGLGFRQTYPGIEQTSENISVTGFSFETTSKETQTPFKTVVGFARGFEETQTDKSDVAIPGIFEALLKDANIPDPLPDTKAVPSATEKLRQLLMADVERSLFKTTSVGISKGEKKGRRVKWGKPKTEVELSASTENGVATFLFNDRNMNSFPPIRLTAFLEGKNPLRCQVPFFPGGTEVVLIPTVNQTGTDIELKVGPAHPHMKSLFNCLEDLVSEDLEKVIKWALNLVSHKKAEEINLNAYALATIAHLCVYKKSPDLLGGWFEKAWKKNTSIPDFHILKAWRTYFSDLGENEIESSVLKLIGTALSKGTPVLDKSHKLASGILFDLSRSGISEKTQTEANKLLNSLNRKSRRRVSQNPVFTWEVNTKKKTKKQINDTDYQIIHSDIVSSVESSEPILSLTNVYKLPLITCSKTL